MPFISWISSRMRVRLPRRRRAASRASAGVMPRATFSAVSISRYDSSSRARSRSQRVRASQRRSSTVSVLGRPQHLVDRADEPLPAAGLVFELLPPGGCEAVVARLAVVLGRAPERRDPAAVLEPVQGG